MVRIGVTGLMASGKSTVARRFEERGAVRIDADALGWETLRIPEVKARIADAFGASVLDSGGNVDRSHLGRIVFPDAEAMRRLNAIVQPALLAAVRERLRSAKAEVLVLDAALISTWGLEPELDGLVDVTAPERLRVARLRAARGLTEEEALERVRGQTLPPLHGARRLWQIENDRDLEALLQRADEIWKELTRSVQERRVSEAGD